MHDHGHEQSCGDCLREWVEGVKGGKNGTTVIAYSIKYNLKNTTPPNKMQGKANPKNESERIISSLGQNQA